MTELYAAGAVLILAQIIGLYALRTHKADLVFSIVMVVLVALAFTLAGFGAYGLRKL